MKCWNTKIYKISLTCAPVKEKLFRTVTPTFIFLSSPLYSSQASMKRERSIDEVSYAIELGFAARCCSLSCLHCFRVMKWIAENRSMHAINFLTRVHVRNHFLERNKKVFSILLKQQTNRQIDRRTDVQVSSVVTQNNFLDCKIASLGWN